MIAGTPAKSKIWIFYYGGEYLSSSGIVCARTVEVQKCNGKLKYCHFACRYGVLTKQEGR
jgi:hypothetical protein